MDCSGMRLSKNLKAADKGGYAIPAFNYSDLWDLYAILEAAKELQAPVIFASIPKVIHAITPQICGAIGIQMMQVYNHTMHHLDHSVDPALCIDAIDYGYPSVMIDASKEILDVNISVIQQVVDYAHKRGVHVEGEIGRIKGRDYEGSYSGDDILVNVDEAVRLVKETRVDSLAVGIGTAHGFYQGKPELNFKRLREVNEAIDIPLVLHGGTGLPVEDVRKAIELGINKVNVGTELRVAFLRAVQYALHEKGPATHPIDVFQDGKKAVKEVVKTWIRVCMAEGKATDDLRL